MYINVNNKQIKKKHNLHQKKNKNFNQLAGQAIKDQLMV